MHIRRVFCVRIAFAVAAHAAALPCAAALADDKAVEKTTHTYKRVGDLEIQADVYRPRDDEFRPVVMWIHGGALISGSRSGVSQRVLEDFTRAGYAVVSIDYRLAPETKLPGNRSRAELLEIKGFRRAKGRFWPSN
jgi:acetyl esterase/lipase